MNFVNYNCPVSESIPHAPYIKPKGFLGLLMPIVIKGVPAYADSIKDPSVLGTVEHEEFWNKELDKIVNGFWIKDIWIPGRFYYYMNYKQMSTIRGVITPDMVDLHLELAYHIEYCLANGKNLLCAKGRRKGISEATSTMVIDYGWRFQIGFKGGVAAGKKTYVEDFVSKWRFADSKLPPELSVKKLTDNDDEIIAGYQIKSLQGTYEDKGTFNTIYARTMHNNPNMFKGLYLNAVISEEVGEHENWVEFYGATKDCLKDGPRQVGILIAFGTAGNVNKGSKDFKKIWYDPHTYNFVRFMIPADRFYKYGIPKDSGRVNSSQQLDSDSELYKKHSEYQLIGVEDRESSLKAIMDSRAKMLKLGNLKEYNEDLQNNPINESEMFRKTVVNNFNINKLNDQQAIVDALTHPKWTKYKMDWVKDDKGLVKTPRQVNLKPIGEQDDQDECIWIIDGETPRKNMSNLYSAGLDGYDQDTAKASKSLGSMCIRIRNNGISSAMKNAPIAIINCRPRRKEIFYELCLKAAVLYDLHRSVLVDVGAGLVMQYFKECGGWGYLADRPVKFESESSEQTHEKGVRLTNFSRPRMASLMQTDIEDNVGNYWFSELINQLGNYDEVEIGSDNDLADAHGLSIMQDVSSDVKPRNEDENQVNDRWEIPKMISDGNGGLLVKGTTNGQSLQHIQQDRGTWGLLFGEDRT